MKQVCLGDVAEVNPRVTAALKALPDQDIAFLPMDAVGEDGSVRYQERRLASSVLTGYTLFKKGDVLLAKITPCMENGKAAYLDNLATEYGAGSTEFHVLRPGPDLDGRFLFYLIWNPAFRAKAEGRMTGSAGQKRVPADFLRDLSFKCPPLDEQRRIAAILDKADAIRRKRQQALALADDFLRSAFLEMFGDPVTNPKGWPEVALEDIATINSGLTKGRNLAGRDVVSLPYMRVANVQDGHLNLSDIKTIDLAADEVSRFLLHPGDILLTEGGDPDKLGRGAVWNGEIENCVHQNHIFRVTCDRTKASPDFVSAQIGSQRGKKYFLRSAKQTTGIATINKTQLKAFPLLLPPLDVQRGYKTIVRKVEDWKQHLVTLTLQSEALFASLSQRAFRGEL
ncbi:MAG: restriction endonuclease subunit S [Bacteroidales bacterium]